MWNTPTKEELAKIPRLYETENIPLKDKIIHMHFFIGGCDWYIAEYRRRRLVLGLCHPERRHGNGGVGVHLIHGTAESWLCRRGLRWIGICTGSRDR